MPKREERYRGYAITGDLNGRGWCIEAHPTRPDLPILRRASFRVLHPNWARRCGSPCALDAALSIGELSSALRSQPGGSDHFT